MGDGGVAWVHLRSLDGRSHLGRVLGPFDFFRDSSMDIGDDSRADWMRRNSNPSRVVGPYGTDFGSAVMLDELPTICEELRGRIDDVVLGLGPDATFGDLFDELATRQSWLSGGGRLDTCLRRVGSLPRSYAILSPARVRDWLTELADLVVCVGDRKRAASRPADRWRWTPVVWTEETWT